MINRIIPPVLWDFAKRLSGRTTEDSVPPFVDKSVGSFSQFGEDLILDALLGCPTDGVYVDVGANDPEVLSNTLRFYKRGWRGINVEPNTALYDEFERQRPTDINLNIGIAPEAGALTFYRMEPSTLSTFDQDSVKDNLKYPNARLAESIQVTVQPLGQVLDAHLGGRRIDFLSVDTEGLDLAVLQSNDWTSYRPRVVLVEMDRDVKRIVDFLRGQRYSFVWSNGLNGMFLDQD